MNLILAGLLSALLPFLQQAAVEESNLDDIAADQAEHGISAGSTAPEKVRAARAAAIRQDLKHVAELEKKIGDPEAYRKKMQAALKAMLPAIKARQGKWDGNAYYVPGYVSSRKLRPGTFMQGVLSWRDYLKKENVDLIVVRVPDRHEVAFPHFADCPVVPGVLNPDMLQLQKELLEADIEYIDGLEAMHLESGKYPLSYWYMIPNQGHPAEGLSRVLARVIAKRLERYGFRTTGKYHERPCSRLHFGQKYPAGNAKYPAGQPVTANGVVDQQGKVLPIAENHASPVLFTSDSYGAYPNRQEGASIPHYVAMLTGHAPDWMYRDGSSGGNPTFLYRKGTDFIRGRQVVVAICHPGNISGIFTIIPPVELQQVPAENWQTLARFDRTDWTKLPSDPAVNSHAQSLKVQPDGSLLLVPLKNARGEAGTVTLRLSPEQQKYSKLAVRLTIAGHGYATLSVTSGKNFQSELLTTTETVRSLLIPVFRDGGTLRFRAAAVSLKPRPLTLKSIEFLGAK